MGLGPPAVPGGAFRNVGTPSPLDEFGAYVLLAGPCGKTHRELPEGLVPYKRHDLNSLCEIAEALSLIHI